jgi:hypothetical protein
MSPEEDWMFRSAPMAPTVDREEDLCMSDDRRRPVEKLWFTDRRPSRESAWRARFATSPFALREDRPSGCILLMDMLPSLPIPFRSRAKLDRRRFWSWPRRTTVMAMERFG